MDWSWTIRGIHGNAPLKMCLLLGWVERKWNEGRRDRSGQNERREWVAVDPLPYNHPEADGFGVDHKVVEARKLEADL